MQKKIALVNDISGFGRCSVTVALPIISYLGVQCAPVLTSVFSNHTGYPNYFFDDYTDRMEEYLENWKKLGLTFEGISTGFLGSAKQIAIVKKMIGDFSKKDTLVIVDPVMGDHGKVYSTLTEELCMELKELVKMADITTPNLTESCRLTDTPYRETDWKKEELLAMAEKIAALGPSKVVMTGIPQGESIANYVYEKGAEPGLICTHKVDAQRSGTGDIFAAVIAADGVNGVPFGRSVQRASSFVRECILKSIEMEIPPKDGVCFEEILYRLERS